VATIDPNLGQAFRSSTGIKGRSLTSQSLSKPRVKWIAVGGEAATLGEITLELSRLIECVSVALLTAAGHQCPGRCREDVRPHFVQSTYRPSPASARGSLQRRP